MTAVDAQHMVLHLITGLGVGGAERVVLELSRSRSEFSPIICSLRPDQALLCHYPDNEFDVSDLGMAKSRPGNLLAACLRLIRIAKSRRVCLIHAHMFHAAVVALLCKPFLPGVKLCFTSHSASGFSLLRSGVLRWSRRWRDGDIVFSASQHPRMNARLTRIIPNGVEVPRDCSATAPAFGEPFVFIFVGRLEPVKNPFAVIVAAERLARNDFEIWFVGDGSLRDELERLARRSVHATRIRFLGVRRDVPQLLQGAHCMVVTSLWEGLPMAMLEAGARGLPVIAPPVGSIPEVINEETGYLVVPASVHVQMERVMEDYSEALRRGRALRNHVIARHGMDRMRSAHLELYREVLHSGAVELRGEQ